MQKNDFRKLFIYFFPDEILQRYLLKKNPHSNAIGIFTYIKLW